MNRIFIFLYTENNSNFASRKSAFMRKIRRTYVEKHLKSPPDGYLYVAMVEKELESAKNDNGIMYFCGFCEKRLKIFVQNKQKKMRVGKGTEKNGKNASKAASKCKFCGYFGFENPLVGGGACRINIKNALFLANNGINLFFCYDFLSLHSLGWRAKKCCFFGGDGHNFYRSKIASRNVLEEQGILTEKASHFGRFFASPYNIRA